MKIVGYVAIALLLSCALLASLHVYRRFDVFDLLKSEPLASDRILLDREYACGEDLFMLTSTDSYKILSMAKGAAFPVAPGSSFVGEAGEHFSIDGFMYVVPEWLSIFFPTVLIPYLRHGIFMKYDPFNETVFLSEDCERLAFDYEYGLVLSNVPPTMLGIDIEKLRQKIRRDGDSSSAWMYRGYRRDR